MNKYLLLLLLPFVTFVSYGVNGSDQDLKLWYDRPADYWHCLLAMVISVR